MADYDNVDVPSLPFNIVSVSYPRSVVINWEGDDSSIEYLLILFFININI